MTEETIYQEMLAQFQQETGYTLREDAELSVRLRASARQIAGLYHYGDYVLRQAFPQTAEGESLERHGALREVTRLEARSAEGTLRFQISEALAENLTIPAGTVCMTEERVCFETLDTAILLAGNTSTDTAARALETGSGGNVLAGQITRMQTRPEGVETVTNPGPFTGGRDREEDDHYRKRILEAYSGLSNGANAAYYKQLAMAVSGVDDVEVIPCMDGAGTVGILVSTDSGSVSQSVLSAVSECMEQRRELGIQVTVITPAKVEVTVRAKLQPRGEYTLVQAEEAVEQALQSFFAACGIGKNVYRSALIAAAMDAGVIDDISLTEPAADISISSRQRAVLKKATLEGM